MVHRLADKAGGCGVMDWLTGMSPLVLALWFITALVVLGLIAVAGRE